MKEEALKLAEIFEDVNRAKYPYYLDVANIIRRLVEELDKVPEVVFDEGVYRWELPNGDEFVIVPQSQKRLSDDEIEKIAVSCSDMDYGSMHIDASKFARAIEERHGIK